MEDYVHVFIFLAYVVLQVIIAAAKQKKKRGAQGDEQPEEEAFSLDMIGESVERALESPETTETSASPVSRRKVVAETRVINMSSTDSRRQIHSKRDTSLAQTRRADAELLHAKQRAQERIALLGTTCRQKGFRLMGDHVRNLFGTRVDRMVNVVSPENSDVTPQMRDAAVRGLLALETQVTFVEKLVCQREYSISRRWGAVDVMVTECWQIWNRHMTAYRLRFPAVFPVGVEAHESPEAAGLTAVPIPSDVLYNPLRMIQIPGLVVRAMLFSDSGFQTSVTHQLSLPDARGSMFYFMRTGRLTSSGLVSGWLPWLFADTVGALQIGEAFGWALVKELETLESDTVETVCRVNETGDVLTIPTIARLLLVNEVLSNTEMSSDALRERVSNLLEQTEHTQVYLEVARMGRVPVSTDLLSVDIRTLAYQLVRMPLETLAGFSLSDIPGLTRTSADVETVRELEMALQSQQVSWYDSAIHLLAAAWLEVSRQPFSAARISKLFLDALIRGSSPQKVLGTGTSSRIHSLPSAFRSRKFVVDAARLSALSTRHPMTDSTRRRCV